jgi:DNA-binding NarL/FixJ family response regulator
LRHYASDISAKLGVSHRAEAAAYATRFKLAELTDADLPPEV